MNLLSTTRITELEKQLELIHLTTHDPLVYARQGVLIILNQLEELKTKCINYTFPCKKDEIYFFKECKPVLTSKLIYYNEIYNIETNCAFKSKKASKKYCTSELKKMKLFFQANKDFYSYYKTRNTFLDNKYFRRGKHDWKLSVDNIYIQADNRFSTSHDFMVARILANENLKVYLENKIQQLNKSSIKNKAATPETTIKWTGTKVGIIELIYALHAEGVFNYGKADLINIVRYFEKSFALDLGQFHRTFFEISARKSERTKFLNTLQEKLLQRMEDRDKI